MESRILIRLTTIASTRTKNNSLLRRLGSFVRVIAEMYITNISWLTPKNERILKIRNFWTDYNCALVLVKLNSLENISNLIL